MICPVCFYNEEHGGDEFIGVFPAGSMLKDTNGDKCGIYACPKCKTVQYTNDEEYLDMRKSKYIRAMKSKDESHIKIVMHDEAT